MPYAQYLEIVESCKSNEIFARWAPNNQDAAGKDSAPLELLVLTSLRYLGRGWMFDDLSESTAISEEVIRVFFHKFIEYGSSVLYQQYVVAPTTVDDAIKHSHEFEMAGLPGAIGSMDASHVLHERITYRQRQSHLGFKLNSTARSYNLVVNHRRRILGTTDGHPARWNDKTIVRFDKIATGLRNGSLLNNFTFELYDYDSNGNVKKVKYKGPWILVDNGYHRWSVTIPPFKATTSRKEIRFSEWLESMRKDVECTFGILKGRWRILKTGIRIHGLDAADQVWKTCCALHNYLLEVDGLDSKWESGVASDWEGPLGEHDDEDVPRIRALERLNNAMEARNYDTSGRGYGSDQVEEENSNKELDDGTEGQLLEEDGCISVPKLSFDYFHTKLVTHFDIAFKKREVKWPEQNRVREPTI
jgi:hypothetical protein